MGWESPPPLPLPPLPGRSEFTLSLWGRRGEGGPLDGVGPENHIKLTKYSTEYRIQNTPAAKLMYIKLTIYLFFIWRLDFIILMGANPLLGPLEGVGPEI